MTRIALVHPGQMGASIGACAVSAGQTVAWASEGRSTNSQQRAADIPLQDAGDLMSLCTKSDVVISVCPPDRAVSVASDVIATGFNGIYVDCNAIAPGTAHQVAEVVHSGQGQCVDGGIIGPPAWQSGSTRLYLSGEGSDQIVPLFDGSALDARVVSNKIGAASALKMAYAGWTKGSAALLMTVFAMAKQQQVDESLIEEWSLSQPGVHQKLNSSISGNAPKAWRFVGEMREIQSTLKTAGLPEAWFDGAAQTYDRLAEFKNISPEDVDLEAAVAALINSR